MVLTYPTLTNKRTCEGANAIKGECINFNFDTTTALITAGNPPTLLFSFDGTASTNAASFTVLNTVFTVDNTINNNTADTVNLSSGNAETDANRFYSMLTSNPAFEGWQFRVQESGGQWIVEGEYCDKVLLSPFVNDVSNINLATFLHYPGDNEVQENQYALVYQVWIEEGADLVQVFPEKGKWQKADIQQEPDGTYKDAHVDIKDTLQGFVSTTLPFFNPNATVIDPLFRKRFKIFYAYSSIDDCGRIVHDAKQTDWEWVYHTALQAEDKNGMCPYVWLGLDDANNVIQRRFLTRRPNGCVHFDDDDWLYVLFDDTERRGVLKNLNVRVVTLDKAGSQISTTNNNYGNEGGVYRIPSGFSNTGAPTNAHTIEIRVRSGSDTVINYTVIRKYCKKDITLYFLNDLGGYDHVCFKAESGIQMDIERTVECIEAGCIEAALETTNFKTTYSSAKRKPISIKGMIKHTAISDWYSSNDDLQKELFIRSFAHSPCIFAKRSIMIGENANDWEVDAYSPVYIEDVGIEEDDKRFKLSVTYYTSKNQNVQL